MEGEVHFEGPHQAAVLLEPEEVGRVNFGVSTGSERARRLFNQGVAQLHGFWFYEAERSFRQVLAEDPECGMAYWGLAVANRNDSKRARGFLEKVEPFLAGLSPVERRWVEAFKPFFLKDAGPDVAARGELLKALEAMAFDFPEDVEVKAWVVLQAWENSNHGIPIGSREGLDALLREVLEVEPWHPGAHHFRIHLWNKADDRRALRSASVCGQSAPWVAHQWHMPAHTFSQLKRYRDAAWQQEAALRADHQWMLGRQLFPDEIHNYAHNADWLVGNLRFLGRVQEALSLARSMVALPRLAPGARAIGNAYGGEERSSYRMGGRQLVETLKEWELWGRLVEEEGGAFLGVREDLRDEAGRLGALVAAYSGLGRMGEAAGRYGEMESVLGRIRMERVERADVVEREARRAGKGDAEIGEKVRESLKKNLERVEVVESLLAEARMNMAFGRGELDLAAAELVGAKRLGKVEKARANLRVCNWEEALRLARESMEEDREQVLRLATWAEVLWGLGREDEAVEAFGRLRRVAGEADLGLPVFGRLKPLIRRVGVSGDWRLREEAGSDTGVRPRVENVGPQRWKSPEAPAWALPGEGGVLDSSGRWEGRPYLMMFYLGSGCVHCIEQLNQFAPMAQRYREQGIELLAVSTDVFQSLPKTMDKVRSEGGFPFKIVSDSELRAFRDFGAFDDFEGKPLHGLFLIDGKGVIRWQNISAEPFTQAEWLLKEAVRLLRF